MQAKPEVQQQSPKLAKSISTPPKIADVTPTVSMLDVMPGVNEHVELRQETTRSKLAIDLINILAGALMASFRLIAALTIMSGSIDEKRTESFDKSNSLVKNLVNPPCGI